MHIDRNDRSEPDWGMWAGDTLHDAILIVTLDRAPLASCAERFASSGHFVLVCAPAAVAEVLKLAWFELVIVLDDVTPAVREGLDAIFAARLRPPAQVLDDSLSSMAPAVFAEVLSDVLLDGLGDGLDDDPAELRDRAA